VTLTPTADAGSTFTGWSGACTGTGTCTVTMDQDRAVTATFDVAAQTPRSLKQEAVASLEALLPTGHHQADRKIHEAIEEINDSDEARLWLDDSHLTVPGRRVFHEEREAARALQDIRNPAVDVATVLDSLVAADEALARTAIDEAAAAGGDPTKLARAERQMDRAAELAAMGHFAKAIRHTRGLGTKHSARSCNNRREIRVHARPSNQTKFRFEGPACCRRAPADARLRRRGRVVTLLRRSDQLANGASSR
jgi:hypothetical protein